MIKTLVGYCGGTEPNPTYELVSSEKTGYREAIQITYDPAKISYDQLLDIYWRQIDPTQADGQFTDIGPSYRAAIFYGNGDEKKIAEASKEKLARSGKFNKPIVTEILPAMKFYPAEAYHQKYYQQNPEHFEAFEEGSGGFPFKRKRGAKSASITLAHDELLRRSTDGHYRTRQAVRLRSQFVWRKDRSGVL